MAQTTLTVKMGSEKWVSEINAGPTPSVKVQLQENWIIGDWGYDAGAVIEVDTRTAQQLVKNGKAIPYKEPQRKPGWPKGRPRK